MSRRRLTLLLTGAFAAGLAVASAVAFFTFRQPAGDIGGLDDIGGTKTLPQDLTPTEEAFRARLGRDNPDELARQKGGWRGSSLGSFYRDELGVDLAVVSVASFLLQPREDLPQYIWRNLKQQTNMSTTVSKAVANVDTVLEERTEDLPRKRNQ